MSFANIALKLEGQGSGIFRNAGVTQNEVDGLNPSTNYALIFPSHPVPFNGQNYKNQKGPRTSDQLLLRL